jgi:hypothetical protein
MKNKQLPSGAMSISSNAPPFSRCAGVLSIFDVQLTQRLVVGDALFHCDCHFVIDIDDVERDFTNNETTTVNKQAQTYIKRLRHIIIIQRQQRRRTTTTTAAATASKQQKQQQQQQEQQLPSPSKLKIKKSNSASGMLRF